MKTPHLALRPAGTLWTTSESMILALERNRKGIKGKNQRGQSRIFAYFELTRCAPVRTLPAWPADFASNTPGPFTTS